MTSDPYSKCVAPALSRTVRQLNADLRMDFIHRPDLATQRFVTIGGALLLIAGLIVWMTGFAKGPSLAECRIFSQLPAFTPHFNATMRVRGNSPCRIPIEVQAGSIEDLQLTMAPESGVVTLDRDGVSYQPSPGFRGMDFFAFAVRGHTEHFDGTSIARVHVFVK